MDAKTMVNSIGIVLNIVGVYMVYVNSPINFYEIDGGEFDDDSSKYRVETERKNRLLRVGVFVVIVGSVIQLVSNFIPSN
jgi:ClpP class serine protease